MMDCDALVVGAGPAGATCARALVAEGRSVVVLERQRFPRDKTCAGWITPPVLELAGLDPVTYAERRVLQPVTRLLTGLIGDAEEDLVETDYGRVVSWGIRRSEFDDYLLGRSGATLVFGEGLLRLDRRGDAWVVNDHWRAPVVIGAGGHFCPVARRLARESWSAGRTEAVVVAQEAEVPVAAVPGATDPVVGARPEFYFCPDLAGYGWAFRKGPVLNVGLGREDATDLTAHLHAFVAWLTAIGRVPRGFAPRFRGHAYLTRQLSRRPPVGEGLVLVGDAAGLAAPESGEGIRPAMESGLLAARAVIAADGCYTRERLAPYAHALRSRFGAPREVPTPARAGPLRRAIARSLLHQPWFVRHVVLDRWFLQRQQPALAEASPVAAAPLAMAR
ncbi:MAG: NAD(P)/FAD-dependent oxidoreductase [Gemmatimonadetes bacterium]|nr:NAD(P)/FAD-dependent oxidoreductase [Gemmatimonadota bacterium]